MERYFLSYATPTGDSFSFGYLVLLLDRMITTAEDLGLIAKGIEERYGCSAIVIINFQHMCSVEE